MRKYSARFFSSGLIQTLPLLVVALLIIIGSVALTSGKGKSNGPKGVLSESESGGGSSGGTSGGDHGGSSGSGSSGTSGSSGSSSSGTSGSSGPTSTTSPSGTPKVEIRKVETEIKNENETELPELENEEEFEVAEGTEEAKIRIASSEGRFRFLGRRFGAETEFPVSVNGSTHELTITTPAGVRIVGILPDSAVENMLAENVIDRVIGAGGRIVEVKVGPDGNLIYEIQGAKDEKFLGLVGVAIPRTLEVSTQNGQLLTVNQSLIDRFLDLISF